MTSDEFFATISATQSYVHTKPLKLFVIDQWYDVSNWPDVKKTTYNKVLEKHPNLDLRGGAMISNSKSSFRRAGKLANGKYIEVEINADKIVRHCYQLLDAAGYKIKNHWQIKTIEKKSNTCF